MNRRYTLVIVSLLGLLLGAGSLAAPKGGQQFYRYKNAQGNLVIESSIPPEYVSKGYQVVTISGQVIRDVPPSDADPGAARQQSEDAAKNLKLDNQLRKLYSAPIDAVRHRDRQIEAVKLKLEFARGQVLQLNGKRKAELDQAARMERSGKKVPEQTSSNIASLDRRIAEQETEARTSEAEIQRLREEFAVTIGRLNVIYPNKALPNEAVAPAPAAAAAAPASASVPAAAPAKPAATPPAK